MKKTLIFTLLALVLFTGAFSILAYAYTPPDADTEDYMLSSLDEHTESSIPSSGGTITPDGSGSVVDKLPGSDGKEFYTIKAPDGNIFYLVIDMERKSDNVYFLNAVTVDDLMSLAQKKPDDKSAGTSAIPTKSPAPQDPEPSPSPEPPEKPPEQKGGGNGAFFLLIIAVIALGGVSYYFKIVRPKQLTCDDEMDDEFGENDLDYDDGHVQDNESENSE